MAICTATLDGNPTPLETIVHHCVLVFMRNHHFRVSWLVRSILCPSTVICQLQVVDQVSALPQSKKAGFSHMSYVSFM